MLLSVLYIPENNFIFSFLINTFFMVFLKIINVSVFIIFYNLNKFELTFILKGPSSSDPNISKFKNKEEDYLEILSSFDEILS